MESPFVTFIRTALLVSVVSWLVLAPTSLAQEGPRVLSIQEAVRIALENNKELSAARLDVDRANAQVKEAWGYAMPTIDLAGRYTNALKKPVFFLPPEFTGGNPGDPPLAVPVGTDHSFDFTLTGQQPLFDATIFIGVGASRVYAQAAREQFRSVELQTISSVQRAYYRVLLARAVRDLFQANLENAEANLKNVRALARQGLVPEYDELRATVGAENLKPALIQAENSIDIAMNALRSSMGLELENKFVIDDSLHLEWVSEELMTSATNRVLQANLSLRTLRLQVEVAEAFMKAERSNYLPRLYGFGNYQYQAAKNDLNVSTNDFINSIQVGVQLSMNIFQGFQTDARVEQASIDMRRTEEQVANLELNLRSLAESIVLRLRESRRRIEAQERTVEQAQRGYDIATTRFVNGLGTQLEVNDSQVALTQARVNRIQAYYDYVVASVDLNEVLGLLPDYVSATLEK
jgi:outer membrane protein TolC